MRCGANRYRGHLSREADATNAVAAYDLAEQTAIRDVKRIVRDFVAALECPTDQGCSVKDYDDDSLNIRVRRVWGAPSPALAGYYRIRAQAEYTFTVFCREDPPKPVEDEGPKPEEEDPVPPTGTGTVTPPGTGTGTGTSTVTPPPGPCIVTFTSVNNSTRTGTGVFTWHLNLTVTASASNPTHGFAAGSCRITGVHFSSGEPLNWTLANYFDQTRDLTKGYGLSITPGAGVATLTGDLVPGLNGIAPIPGSRIQVLGSAIDSNGETADFEFILPTPP